jgi:hypothetical protein
MTVKLLTWNSKAIEVDVGDIETIGAMRMRVVSGDEILTVIYKDYTISEFDSSSDRCMNFYDGEYDVYNAETGLNLFNKDVFMNRRRSYWFYDEDEEL